MQANRAIGIDLRIGMSRRDRGRLPFGAGLQPRPAAAHQSMEFSMITDRSEVTNTIREAKRLGIRSTEIASQNEKTSCAIVATRRSFVCDHYALIRLSSPHLRKSDHERITGAGPLQRCNSIAHGRSCGQDTVILRRMAGGLW
jgi:hypothetical protein